MQRALVIQLLVLSLTACLQDLAVPAPLAIIPHDQVMVHVAVDPVLVSEDGLATTTHQLVINVDLGDSNLSADGCLRGIWGIRAFVEDVELPLVRNGEFCDLLDFVIKGEQAQAVYDRFVDQEETHLTISDGTFTIRWTVLHLFQPRQLRILDPIPDLREPSMLEVSWNVPTDILDFRGCYTDDLANMTCGPRMLIDPANTGWAFDLDAVQPVSGELAVGANVFARVTSCNVKQCTAAPPGQGDVRRLRLGP